MICNNTNIPAIENIISGCNNGCEPKDINIVCRKMIIPSGQEILCVQGDNNSTIRNFVIPNVTENGVSLKDKILNIVLENSKKEYFRINLKNEDIIYLDSYIKIKWNILDIATKSDGILKVAIEAVGDNFKWQTYAGIFYINKSVINPDIELSLPSNSSEENNCNKNIYNLLNIENKNNICNNICEPKNINIICRKMIIPSGQEIIGIQGDINSNIRTFILPIETESGINLKDKTFNMLEQNNDKIQWKTEIEKNNIEITDSYIKIKWNIANNETAVSGKLQVAIEAVGDNFKWQTYAGEFIIIPSLENIKRKIIPTVVLQKKIVFPKVVVQNILPDENYDGLSEVIVNPVTSEIDNNIKPENIKEKISILGIEGSLIELNGEEITINSSREDKEIYPTEGKNAITKINLKAIKFNLQNKEIVENGKYTADKQYDGLGEVIINVQSAPVEQLYSYSEEVWN